VTESTATLQILTPLPDNRPQIRSVLFDFDGTFSTLRQGWETIMAPLMVEMICGTTEPTQAIRDEVDHYIDESTGVQTIHQMIWLAESVRRFGLNPETHDEWWYKAEYLRRLQDPVDARIARIACGEATPEDYMIAGTRPFLEALRNADVTIFVASGSDHSGVTREVGVLGLTDFFTEIAGAPEAAIDCSKEAVLRKLVADAHLAGPEVVVIGDGKVEIALGREAGTITLGTATDEIRRSGINPVKVGRLTRAGAHAIVGDFLCYQEIMQWLGL
jgi:phosphoglycolate phosphatase-like HAD superfamily hydrolase